MMVSPKYFVFLVLLSVGVRSMPHETGHRASIYAFTCDLLSPVGEAHGTTTQTTSPYTITLSTDKVKAGDKVTVTITGNESNSFKGVMVQARDYQNRIVGTFVKTDDTNKSKTVTCDNPDDTIAQRSTRTEVPTASFEWIAPAAENVHEKVVFYVTILKSMTEFLVKLPSEPLTIE